MPSDGLRAVNVYALETAQGLVLVDGGWAVASASEELATALHSVGRSPHEITDVFVTHIHRDHYTFAVRLRADFGARIHLGREERPGLEEIQRMRSNVPFSSLRELRRAGAAVLAGKIEAATASEPLDVRDWADPDEWIGAGPLGIEGWALEAVHTPGHTKGHLVFHDEGRRLLFSGDHVLPTITPSIGFELGEWDLPLKRYFASLELLLHRADAMLLPAHGQPTESVHQRVRTLLEHHRARFDSVMSVLASAGATVVARDVAERLLWTRREVRFAELDEFNRMIAICETLAHLDVLVDRGDVTSVRAGEVEGFAARTARMEKAGLGREGHCDSWSRTRPHRPTPAPSTSATSTSSFPLTACQGARMTATPRLEHWFATMDSDVPEGVLDQITDDFEVSILFSRGDGQSAEFRGDRPGLVAYLEQREKGTLVHEIIASSTVDDVELCLGRTTRGGQFEAQFNASAQIDPASGKVRRLLICRTPEIEFG